MKYEIPTLRTGDSILQDLVEMLTDLTSDWDRGLGGPIGAKTRLVADLGFDSVDDVQVNENDFRVDLLVNMVLQLNEDGSYRLRYTGRWGKKKPSEGITVDESGTFKLSSDVLILDPIETHKTVLEKNKPVNNYSLGNEKHLFVVHWETKRIHVAGKCAPYQVDPICKDWQVENVWFTLQGGAKKLKAR